MGAHPPDGKGDFTVTAMEPLTKLQTSAYLDRLGIAEKSRTKFVPDLATLNGLIAAHVRRIMFHGVDAFLGRSPSLDTEDIFRKVIEQDRGGYCFELNTLFARLLTRLGYRLQLRPARVRWRFPTDDKIPLPVTHVLICVELGEPGRQYFVDVGFGSVANPFRAIPVSEDFQETTPYRVRLLDSASGAMELALLDRRPGATEGRWRCLYDVDRHPVEIVDLVPLNWYGGTHPDSVFRRALIAGRWAGDFWVTLRNNCMIRRWPSGEAEESRTIGSADEVVEFLEKEFGLALDHDTETEPLRSRLEEVIRAEAQG